MAKAVAIGRMRVHDGADILARLHDVAVEAPFGGGHQRPWSQAPYSRAAACAIIVGGHLVDRARRTA